MVNKTHIRLIAAVIVLMLVSLAWAEEEQWLQYRSSQEASDVLTHIHYYYLKTDSEISKEAELPEFNTDSPLFTKWSSPMVKNGFLWIALDRAGEYGAYERMFIDSNGDGHLKDETAVMAYRAEGNHSYFGPVKVIFEGEDSPITYHLNFRLCDHGNRSLRASTGGWYEGDIVVGEKTLRCILMDYNANGTFNDTSMDFSQIDRIKVGTADNLETRFVGKYIEIEGAFYRPELARGGASIKLTALDNVPMGTIRIPQNIGELSTGGENGLFVVKPKNGLVRLPVGKYRLDYWQIEREDKEGNSWKLRGESFSDRGLLDVSENEEIKLSIGEPIAYSLTVSGEGGTRHFSQNLKGQLGENVALTCNGARPQAPKLRVKSADGTYNQTFDFKYG